MDPSDEDSRLLDRSIRDRNETALKRLLYQVGTECERFVATLIPTEFRSLISAEDVVQNARFRALLKLHQFHGTTYAEFMTWFRRLASNLLRSEIRHWEAKKRGGERLQVKPAAEPPSLDELSTGGPSPRQHIERKEVIHAVRANLENLPTTQRQAVRLHHLDSYSIAETAEQLGESPTRIRVLLARATKAMKYALGSSSKWFSR